MAWQQFAANRQRRQATRKQSNEPALTDYQWNPNGFTASEWTSAAKAVVMPIGLSIFLSMFNWWAFFAHGDWMVKAMVILFDCIALFMWWQAAQRVGCALKFGQSRIVFTRFPYRLGEPVVIRWQAGRGIYRVRKGKFTLRCVEEWGVKEQNQEEIWTGAWILEQPRNFQLKDEVELRYELPVDAPATQLSAYRPVFWELEVKLELPGLNFKQSYLVPIYSAKSTPAPSPSLP
jgi:hypothetical protein